MDLADLGVAGALVVIVLREVLGFLKERNGKKDNPGGNTGEVGGQALLAALGEVKTELAKFGDKLTTLIGVPPKSLPELMERVDDLGRKLDDIARE